MTRIILSLSVLLVCIISASAQNTISFDNQSGEPALVKLIGPTPKDIEVPDGVLSTALTSSLPRNRQSPRTNNPFRSQFDQMRLRWSAVNS